MTKIVHLKNLADVDHPCRDLFLANGSFGIPKGMADVKFICQDGSLWWNKSALTQWSGLAGKASELAKEQGIQGLDMTIILPDVKAGTLKHLLELTARGEVRLAALELNDIKDLMNQFCSTITAEASVVDSSGDDNIEIDDKEDERTYEGVDEASFVDVANLNNDTLENKFDAQDMDQSEVEGNLNLKTTNRKTMVDTLKTETNQRIVSIKVYSETKGRQTISFPNLKDRTIKFSKMDGSTKSEENSSPRCHLCPAKLSYDHPQAYFMHLTKHFKPELARDCKDILRDSKKIAQRTYGNDNMYMCSLCPSPSEPLVESTFLRHLAAYPHLKILDYVSRDKVLGMMSGTKLKRSRAVLNKLKDLPC